MEAEFIATLRSLTPQEQKEKCESFLRENPGNPFVLLYLETVSRLSETESRLQERSLEAVRKKFPVLNDATESLPYYPDNHCHADIVPDENWIEATLGEIEKEFMHQSSPIWEAPFVKEGGTCDSEIDSQTLVVCLLEAVLKGLNLDKIVGISQNRTLAGTECDVLLVYKPNRLPFAVIEVKKPGNSEEGRTLVFEGCPIEHSTKDGEKVQTGGNRVAGEVFAEMTAIQFFGYQTVTGMISTGNQWRIVGLLHDDQDSKVLDNFKKFLSGQQPKSDDGALALTTTDPEISPEERGVEFLGECVESADAKIWAGEIVPSHKGLDTKNLRTQVEISGQRIVSQLVLFVAKACSDLSVYLEHSGPQNSIRVRSKMPCRILTNSQKNDHTRKYGVFAFGSISLKKLNLRMFTPNTLKKIYVIQHIGMGEYGNVCLGTSEKGGCCCAIKFYHEKSCREQFAKEERANWESVYGGISGFPMPFILDAEGGNCLVMPYLHPIPEKERCELLDNGVIKTALETFAKSGFIHTGIKWRHFCRWKKDGQENDRVFLLDLGKDSLREEKKSNAIATWVENAINRLRARAGDRIPTDDSPSTPKSTSPTKKKQKRENRD